MNFKKLGRFFRKIVLPGFWGPSLHKSTLINLVNTYLASRDPSKTICMLPEGYRTHRGVTDSMNFKKKLGLFFGKSCSRGFGVPGCHRSTLINLVNTSLASSLSVETICMISEGYRTHRVVAGPMNFKKLGGFFRKIVLPEFWGHWLPSRHFI